jgi:hypothetical protein
MLTAYTTLRIFYVSYEFSHPIVLSWSGQHACFTFRRSLFHTSTPKLQSTIPATSVMNTNTNACCVLRVAFCAPVISQDEYYENRRDLKLNSRRKM